MICDMCSTNIACHTIAVQWKPFTITDHVLHLNCEVGVKMCDIVNKCFIESVSASTSMMMVSALCAAAALSTEY